MKGLGALLADLFAPLLAAVRPLAIVVAGLFIAFGTGAPTLESTATWVGVLVAACAFAFWIGNLLVSHAPRTGLALMEFWVIALVALAVLASAATAKISVSLSAPEHASDQTKVLLTTLTTAACAFLSSAFIAGGTADGSSRLASRIESVFGNRFMSQERYDASDPKPRFYAIVAVGSDEEQAVFGDVFKKADGWALLARWKRAAFLAQAIRSRKAAKKIQAAKDAAEKAAQERAAAENKAGPKPPPANQ